jgi:hypothetical protein
LKQKLDNREAGKNYGRAVDNRVHPLGDRAVADLRDVVLRPLEVRLCARWMRVAAGSVGSMFECGGARS